MAVVVMAASVMIPLAADAGEEAKKINSTEDVLKNWDPNQHLYVKGNLRLSHASLCGFEKWL
ncbi:MAG: hypothetical protein KJO79_05975, partial [Verrucomicrobiae bacterium]|nr:hypothetical protein [Verrucomicrobiae bacterium]NNJ86710.1 hypothetical protein [Akkermansiaceae bacterium]